MARIARIVVEEEEAVYHVMSRTALDGFVLGDGEKDELLKIIKRLSAVYFTEVLGFCIMGNHFQSVHDKVPRTISGVEGVYSLKRLSEL